MERPKPLVSIVLPSYNGERYIRESLGSIMAQMFRDWELIIVNDCSTDSTAKIAESYAAQDHRIRVIHNIVNQKLPTALNIGFAAALGKYLTWTSDDNRYLPCAIESMVRALDEDIAAPMVCADMEYIDEDGEVTGSAPPYDDYLIWAMDLVGACFMYRREALVQVGGYDPAKFCVEDYDYWLRIRSVMGEIKRIPQMLYQYRRHGASLTATKAREVGRQANRLRLEYREKILQAYREDPRVLCALYYEFVMSGEDTQSFWDLLYDLLPEIHAEKREIDEEIPLFVFGAGEYGEKVVETFGERIVGFIDNDKEKIGREKMQRKIISLDEYCQKDRKGTGLILAAGMMNLYDIIKQLQEAGVREFITYQRIAGRL